MPKMEVSLVEVVLLLPNNDVDWVVVLLLPKILVVGGAVAATGGLDAN